MATLLKTEEGVIFVPMIPGTQEWLDYRKKGLGGSDSAAALGQSKYKSPLQLWQEKLDITPAFEGNWNTRRGQALEPAIREDYANKTGSEVILPQGVFVSRAHPFMMATIDGIAGDTLFEAKTAAYDTGWGEPGSDEIPDEYALQVQHCLIVTGLKRADVSVSIRGEEPIFYHINPDHELQELIIEGEREFWEMVQEKREPDAKSAEDIKFKYSRPQPTTIIANDDIEAAVETLNILRGNLKIMDSEKEELENMIKLYIANNEQLVDISGKPLITWKQAQGARRLDAKALEAAHPSIYNAFVKQGEPSRRFLVK